MSLDSADTDAGASIRAIEKQLLGWCYPPAPCTPESYQTPLPAHHWSGESFCEGMIRRPAQCHPHKFIAMIL